ncbi:methyltransferase domain-containing protein [Phycicoccus endophyticus]|uniref:Methyltransferase domain-containing protein n=1 Tax=Phycicoccus endophyticus TaxID=1690220 RepID=A0A7G9R2D9_9MICO|nr:methyltransferase domain-containing protein [Phycicoccus endophyticus]NHI20856.1 methyltransferase domain-containing protein [Phycicoccus endophyticus]QNN49764.1 methyltransferase domain-containing protein [Phycicoccus endophyticus]GGL34947.1 trans-aconitate 2-methyltransferase [Phycicoccus endophyticus]
MSSTASWDPTAYGRYATERARPLADLLARVDAAEPRLVVDLGCGHGPATLALAERWPRARVVGVDAAEPMLDAARALDRQGRVEWVSADLRSWDPASLGEAPDVVVTSSTLQWVPGHLDLVPAWARALAPGGWFALQVPGSFDAPSHRLMRETAERHPRAGELLAALDVPAVAEPATYLRLLARLGATVDAWETTYLHLLDPQAREPNPVLSWVEATGLRPVLDLLRGEEERAAFLEPYAAALLEAYPRTSAGVLFPFRRLFAVAHAAG